MTICIHIIIIDIMRQIHLSYHSLSLHLTSIHSPKKVTFK